MSQFANRRSFLKSSLTLAGTALSMPLLRTLQAVEPFQRKGGPRFALGLAAYSFRDYFLSTDPQKKKITLFDFLDYCADHDVAGAELTSYYFPEKTDAEFLLKVKRYAFLRGVDISGTAVGNNFAHAKGEKRDKEIAMVKRWIENAAILGAPHIRIFAGSKPKELTLEEAKKLCVEAIEECAELAGRKGIFLGLENHHGIVTEPEDLVDIVQRVKSPWVGINLDTGNFNTTDPYVDLAKCAPYAVNVQFKAEIKPKGAKEKQPADLERIAKILRDANYQGYVTLEYEAPEDPFKAVPDMLKTMRKVFGIQS